MNHDDPYFHLEAMMIFQGAWIRFLEQELIDLLTKAEAKPSGGIVLFRQRREAAFDDLLRSMADEFPDRAAELRRYLDELRRGGEQ